MLSEGRKRGGKQGTGLGARSVGLTLGRLNAALELACRDGRLAVNPARYVRLPSQPRRPGTTWSEDELPRFLAVADTDRLAACWRLSVLGERRGEVLGERWDDWNADGGTITVARARILVGGRVAEKSPKSERGIRTLPLDAATMAALTALRKRQLEERLAAGVAYVDSGYIAIDELGRPLHPERYSDQFARLCRQAGHPAARRQAHRQLADGRRWRAIAHPCRLVRPHRGCQRAHLHPCTARRPGGGGRSARPHLRHHVTKV